MIASFTGTRPVPFNERRSLDAYWRWARGCSLAAAFFGGLGLFGWFHNDPLLAQLNRNSVLIAPRAALAFLILGLALYAYLRNNASMAGKCGIVLAGGFVFWLALINEREFPQVYGYIEPLLLKNVNSWEFIYRDRMEPLIAYTFFILGPAALVSPFLRDTSNATRDLMGALSLVVVVVHGMLLLGFLYGTPLSYPLGHKPPSFPSAAASLAMGLAFLGTVGPRSFPIVLFAGRAIRARLLRTFLPIGIISVIIYGLLTRTMFGPLNPALSSLLGIFLSTSIIGFLVLRTAHVVSRQIEHSVRESEERFTILVESIKDYAMIMLDPEGYVVTWNSGAARFTGYSADEIIGEHISCFYLSEDFAAKKPTEDLAEAKAKGSIEKNGWRLRKDGTRFWADVILTAVYDDNGALRGFSEVTRDVTERRRIEEELRERNALILLLQKISAAANESFKIEESFQVTLELICRQMGWPLGHALTFSAEQEGLVSGIWHEESNAEGFAEFRRETDRLAWRSGEGLPGRVLDTGKPVWSTDFKKDLQPARAMAAQRAGLRTGHAFPIFLGTEVVAVLEFFSAQDLPLGSAVLLFMTQVGYQLGQVVERQRIEEKMGASLKEKEVLLKEIHHRVKNNLQIITSLLRLQSEGIQDANVLDMFRESQSRVRSMALVHEYLYKSPDLASIHFPEYVQSIVSSLFRSYGVLPETIGLHLDIEEIPLDLNTAIPTGLIMTELVANVLKHAFPAGAKGELWIQFHARGHDGYDFVVRDNGRGLSPDIQVESADSLGLRLVKTLVTQLRGTIAINRGNGTEFKITLKKQT